MLKNKWLFYMRFEEENYDINNKINAINNNRSTDKPSYLWLYKP